MSTVEEELGLLGTEDTEEIPHRLFDVEIDQERDIMIDHTGDLALTSGDHTVRQAAVIRVGHVIRWFLGGRNTATRVETMRARISRILKEDPRIMDFHYLTVDVSEADNHRININMTLSEDTEYEITVEA